MISIKESEHYTDKEVIDKILEGEHQLYELLIRRSNPFLYRIGRSYGYNHHDTEDLMQETYISAFYSLPEFEGRSSFKTWITRIMLNSCYQKKQKYSFKNEKPAEDHETENTIPIFQHQMNTEKKILNKELGRVLEGALSNIPEDYRLVFTLRQLNGFSTTETSEAVNISEANVKVRLNRAKIMLRSEIERMYSPEDIYEFNLVYCDRMVENVMSKLKPVKN
jgi:RNA polymerase sigma factor (sigma-70 family)